MLGRWDITNSAYITTEKAELAGLGIGIASMRSGERALFHVGWELGYGKEGNFSFPNVPPMADLVYEVELIGYDEAKEVSLQLLHFSLFADIPYHYCSNSTPKNYCSKHL